MQRRISSFTDLVCWQEGHKLVLDVYKITTNFPKTEIYCLIDQMRRCVISITSNIAEGFSRRSKKEKDQFYYMALGSLTELQNQLLVARDLKYLTPQEFSRIASHTVLVSKLIRGLLKSSANHS